MSRPKSFFNWSGGKDSSLALYHCLKDPKQKVELLCTNLSKEFERISMHGVRRELLEQQARSIGLPLQETFLKEGIGMQDFDQLMADLFTKLKSQGFTTAVYGDIFLEDLKAYRDQQLMVSKLNGYYPLWKRDTSQLIREFLDLGFKAIIVSVKSELLDESFVGRELNASFIDDLPENVDPCGENGEFHSFVYDGPIFQSAIDFEIGEKVFKSYELKKQDDDNCFMNQSKKEELGFWFCDLIPREL